MTSSPSKYNISQVSRITGKSRTTITAHIKAGKLSVEQGEQGKVVDASELIRVYGDECDFEQADTGTKSAQTNSQVNSSGSRGGGQSSGDQTEHPQVTTVQAELDREIKERNRERDQFIQQIDHLKEALKLAQEGQSRAMLLIEDGTGKSGDLEKSIKEIENRLAQQERETKQQAQRWKEKAVQLNQELKQEKAKTLWQRLLAS